MRLSCRNITPAGYLAICKPHIAVYRHLSGAPKPAGSTRGLWSSFIPTPGDTPFASQLAKLRGLIDALDVVNNIALKDTITAAFGKSPSELHGREVLNPAVVRLCDTIFCIKYLPEQHFRRLEDFCNQLRDIEVIKAVATNHKFPVDGDTLRRYRQRSFLLPSFVVRLRPSTSTIKAWQDAKKRYEKDSEKRKLQASMLLDDYKAHINVINELKSLSNDHLEMTPQEPRDAFPIPRELSALEVSKNHSVFLKNLADLNLKQVNMALSRSTTAPASTIVDPLRVQDVAGGTSALGFVDKILSPLNNPILGGSKKFKPETKPVFTFKSSVLQSLSNNTSAFLTDKKLDPTSRPLDHLVTNLNNSATALVRQLNILYKQPDSISFTKTLRRLKCVGNVQKYPIALHIIYTLLDVLKMC